MFIAFVLIALALWLQPRGGPEVSAGSTLLVELSGDFVEAPESSFLARILGGARRPFASLLSIFALAERDPRLSAVVLRIRSLGIGWGKAQEMRDAIGRLRKAGKKTVAFLDLADLSVSREYYVASAAEEIYAAPGAIVPLVGLAAEYFFLGGMWEKVGVTIEAERIGRYKSAVESIRGFEMSEAHREMANAILDSIDAQFVGGIAVGRGMSEAAVRSAIDTGPARLDELVALGLLDGVSHLDELPEMQGAVIKGKHYAEVDPASVGFEAVAQFALVYGTGNVVPGDDKLSPRGSPVFASERVSRALLDAAEDSKIAAIIFRIDSPGGSALASEEIWRAVQRVKESGKPLIASFSDVAASGAYYAAAGADGIVASPGVLTGSIGVFILRPMIGELLGKVGIGVESLTRGRHADLLLSTGPLSPGARERTRSVVKSTYELFVDRVAKGRGLTPERVDELGQGRVWTGARAVELGLVDELGGLRSAVDRAKRALGLEEDVGVLLLPYPPPGGLADELRDLLEGGLARSLSGALWGRAAGLRLPAPELLERLQDWWLDLPHGRPLLVPPLIMDVH
ncbi:MAG: signal peptide peptidase SppA [Myxococcota bacterium]